MAKLRHREREAMQVKPDSTRTADASVSWINRFIRFLSKRHPRGMGKAEQRAVRENFPALTRRQARKYTTPDCLWAWQYVFAICLIAFLCTDAIAETEYPDLQNTGREYNDPRLGDISFEVWSRSEKEISGELPKSVVIFSQHLILTEFFPMPDEFADRFWDVNFENHKKKVIFTLLFEPNIHPQNPPCEATWFYYLTVEQAPSGKRFAITQLLISNDGEILYGLDVDPYSWDDNDCPLENNSNPSATRTPAAVNDGAGTRDPEEAETRPSIEE